MGALSNLLTGNNQNWKRMATGAVWSAVGTGSAQAFAFIAAIYTARCLGPALYGRLGIVLATVVNINAVASIVFATAASKHVAQYRDSAPGRAGSFLIAVEVGGTAIATGLCLCLLTFAPMLAERALKDQTLTVALRIGAALTLFEIVNSAQVGALSGLEAFKSVATANIARGVALLATIHFGLRSAGLEGALVSYAVASAVACVVSTALLRSRSRALAIPMAWPPKPRDFRELLEFGTPLLIAKVSTSPVVWWANALLYMRAGNTEAGIFSIALQWQTAIMFVSNCVSTVGLPVLSNIGAANDIRRFRSCAALNIGFTVLLSALAATAIAACSTRIVRLYGVMFASGAPTIAMVCVSATLYAANVTLGNSVWSNGATGMGLSLALLQSVALAIAAYVLTWHGALGLATSHVIMQSCLLVGHLWCVASVFRRVAAKDSSRAATPEVDLCHATSEGS